jgi:membrane protease YdiL (CAAX protease family)
MELKNYTKNLTDYLFLLFMGFSFWQCVKEDQTNILLYYFILVIIFVVVKGTKNGVTGVFTLHFKLQNGKKNYFAGALLILASIIVSITILYLYDTKVENIHYNLRSHFDYKYAFMFFIFNPVRILGEETIFRGLLLMGNIRNDNKLFWILNFVQATVFSMIHSLMVDDLTGKLVFTTYVFCFSIFVGWLNRKFNSILPGYLIHWCNGILRFIFLF